MKMKIYLETDEECRLTIKTVSTSILCKSSSESGIYCTRSCRASSSTKAVFCSASMSEVIGSPLSYANLPQQRAPRTIQPPAFFSAQQRCVTLLYFPSHTAEPNCCY